MQELKSVLQYFPNHIKEIILQNISQPISEFVEEIRIRLNRPIILKIGQELMLIEYIINTEEIYEIFERICENSIYSYKKEICEGFITIKGRTQSWNYRNSYNRRKNKKHKLHIKSKF